jgi:hypothetical protein
MHIWALRCTTKPRWARKKRASSLFLQFETDGPGNAKLRLDFPLFAGSNAIGFVKVFGDAMRILRLALTIPSLERQQRYAAV